MYIYFYKLEYLSGDIYLFFALREIRRNHWTETLSKWATGTAPEASNCTLQSLSAFCCLFQLLHVIFHIMNHSISTAPGMFKSNCLGSIAWIAGFICSETLPGLLGLLLPVETQAATDSLDELHGGSSPRFQPGTTTWTLPRTTNTVRTSAISTTIWMPCSESMSDQAAQRVIISRRKHQIHSSTYSAFRWSRMEWSYKHI